MEIIEQEEKAAFYKVLKQFNLPADDFVLSETDTTDPKTDEILALTGVVVVTRKSVNRSMEYPIEASTPWVDKFKMDVSHNLFGR